MKFQIKINNEQIEIGATRKGQVLVIEHNTQRFEVRVVSAEANHILIEHNGRLLKIAGHRNGEGRQLWVNGRTANYQRVTEDGSSAEDAEGSLSASIPAVVSEILVSVGDTVEAGDKLILLESMKMIIPIQAPTDGTISELLCNVGDSVQPSVPLITLQ